MLGRVLQLIVCLLHHCELPFRHLFVKLDGTTTGPDSFSGPIGKLIAGGLYLNQFSVKIAPIQSYYNVLLQIYDEF